MKDLHKAIMKLAIDIVKVDRSIHQEEINQLKTLREKYGLSEVNMAEVSKLSLCEVINILQKESTQVRQEVIEVLTQIIYADFNPDLKELYLLFAIKMALEDKTKDNVQIFSTDATQIDFYGKQIIYLEKDYNEEINQYINRNYDLIWNTFSNLNIDFFYVPQIIEKWKYSTNFIHEITEYLMPSFSVNQQTKEETKTVQRLNSITSRQFMSEIFSRFNANIKVEFGSFLLMKIQNSYLLNQSGERIRNADFMCIELSRENVEPMLNDIVRNFHPNHSDVKIPFTGYHRILFEILSDETKISFNFIIRKNNCQPCFYLETKEDGYRLSFPLGKINKVFYMLYLIQGEKGISAECFKNLHTTIKPKNISNSEWNKTRHILDNIEFLIHYFDVKDTMMNLVKIFGDPKQRSVKIAEIRRKIKKITNLKNPKQYYPIYDEDADVSRLALDHNKIYVEENNKLVPLRTSHLWSNLTF